MSSISLPSIPNLKLFPIYTGGPILNGKNGLNGSSSFVIPATRFSKSYSVNIAPTTSPFDPNTYLSLNSNPSQRLISKPISDATNYNTPLGMDTSVYGHVSQVSVPTTPPEIPQVFQNKISDYTITEANYNALMAQSSFEIPGVGMGLLVTTDGNGNVQSESLAPSSFSAMGRANALTKDFLGPNRAAISIAATYHVNDPGFTFGDVYAVDSKSGPPKAKPNQNLIDSLNSLTPASGLGKNAGIFNVGGAQGAPGLDGVDPLVGAGAVNPIVARLNQLQPQDGGLSLSGQEAGVDVNQAQQVAASQADFGVNLSKNFYQNLSGVVNAANAQQQTSYAATFAPRVDQLMDGKIDILQAGHGGGYGHGRAPMPQLADERASMVSFNMGASVADATAGNSRNGYIPFKMQSDNSSSGGGGFSDSNPFAGSDDSQGGFQNGAQGGFQGGMNYSGGGRQSDQQQQSLYYRKPMAYSA